MPVCFLMINRRVMDPDGRGGREELEGVKREEIIIKMYYMG